MTCSCDAPVEGGRPLAEDGFDHRQEKHMVYCCCGPMHATVGAKMLGGIFNIFLALGFYGALQQRDLPGALILLGQVFLTSLLLIAIMLRKSWLVLPFLVWTVLSLLIQAVTTVACFVVAVIPYNKWLNDVLQDFLRYNSETEELVQIKLRLVLLFLGFLSFCVSGVEYWFFLIIRRCYSYYRDHEVYKRELKYSMQNLDSQPC